MTAPKLIKCINIKLKNNVQELYAGNANTHYRNQRLK